ncbi:MAG: hypothetical protein LBC61_02540 [Candidatus Peribacteria bacterium]|nr:hypothetical protein [Candidatus Peribacteria bacterium]
MFSTVIFVIKLLASETLLLSLASIVNHCIEIKAIIHKIAKIVITTINSTSIKAFFIIKSVLRNKIF